RRQNSLAGAAHFLHVRQRALPSLDDGRAAGVVLAQLALVSQFLCCQAAEEGCRFLFGDVGLAGVPRVLIVGLDEKPLLLLLAGAWPHPHQVPAALEARAVERNVEVALRQTLLGIERRLPAPASPNDHRPAAVFALRDV